MSKILNKEELISIKSRFPGKRVVFTNGVFDLLHAAHIVLLRYCKSKGDVLVVGINDDDSTRRQKGKRRPIIPLRERMEVLSAVKYVDFIVPFSEDTPLELIKLLKPDVLVKGGDYSLSQIVGAREVIGWGGKVCIFPYMEGTSTSKIIEKVLRDVERRTEKKA